MFAFYTSFCYYKIALSPEARKRIQDCRDYLDRKMETQKEPIYGVTTGFGSLCNISVGKEELSQLQKNLVMSHACGTGERVPKEIVKIILLLKIQSLSYDYWKLHGGENSAYFEHHQWKSIYKKIDEAWLYGCSSVNCSLLGIGERTENIPLEDS